MKNASSNDIEYEFFVNDFCEDCRRWRDDPEAKTQCKIAGHACVGINYKNYWKTDCGKTFCSKWESRKPKKSKPTEMMKIMGIKE